MSLNHVAILVTLTIFTLFGGAWAMDMTSGGGENLGKVTGGDFDKKAHSVIQKRCITCHTDQVIKDAIAAGKDMRKIEADMEKRGARLSASDREVLGIFWNQSPLKEKKK
jgi:uncharacterized membrane protein